MTKLYPGMLDCAKEYFNNGSNVMLLHNGTIQNFDDVSDHPELALIIENDAELSIILSGWFGNNERKKQKKLAKCRFGALNFFADFNGGEIASDYRECPHRGKCIGENIVCKPLQINGQNVDSDEIQILREVSGDDKNSTIASKLGFCLGTFNVKKNNLYKKFRIPTKQHATKILFFEGLL